MAGVTVTKRGVSAVTEGVAAGQLPKTVVTSSQSNASLATFQAPAPNGTDDTAAILALFNATAYPGVAADAQHSVTIQLQQGTYIVSDLHMNYSGLTLRGVGSATTLKAKAGAGAVVRIEGQRRCRLEDLSIDGNGKASIGVRISSDGSISSEQQFMEGVRVTNCSIGVDVNHPLETQSTASFTLPGATLTVASTAASATSTVGFPSSGSLTIRDGTKTAIVNYTGTTATTFTGCTSASTGTWASGSTVIPNGASPVNQADKNTFINCQFIASTTLVRVDAINAQDQVFYGCTFDGPGVTTGVQLNNGSLTTIGCQFQTAGTTAIVVGDIDVQWVNCTDTIFEGHTNDIDGTNYWPLAGVTLTNTVLSGTAVCVRMNTANPVLYANNCIFNTGTVGGSGNGICFVDFFNTFQAGASWSVTGATPHRFQFSSAGITLQGTVQPQSPAVGSTPLVVRGFGTTQTAELAWFVDNTGAVAGRVTATGRFQSSDGVTTKSANTTGLTSTQIDALFTAVPPDGTMLTDATNNVYLQRAGGKWYKSAALTLIP